MATTNTDYAWFWYIRKKGDRYYLGLIDENGDDATAAYDIVIHYDEIPDELTSDDDEIPIPVQFEHYLLKGCAAEILDMEPEVNERKLMRYRAEFEKGIEEAFHFQIEESQQPAIMEPLDLRDD